MFGIGFIKAPPTTHIIHYRRGKVEQQGPGLSFWYLTYHSVIVRINLASIDVPFVFTEVSSDLQDTTLQGELTYRIVQPERAAALLDFSLNARGQYQSDDPTKLGERLVKAAQIQARSFTHRYPLSDLLLKSDELVAEMQGALKSSESLQQLGVELVGLSILSIKATPEMAKALQAKSREQLLLEADQAMHHRRNTAVEMERQIKENELETEIAVETKRRQVRQTQVEADIAVETQRAALVDRQVENQRKEAEARGAALRATLEPLKEIDWRTLVAASPEGNNPRSLIAMAFRDLADNASKIGHLNIAPELLQSLMASATPREDDR
jgi:regulator of protease activity HflC (stomatin/prohibitin superfamily)